MWFEDIPLGDKRDIGSYTFSEAAMIAFARKYDPQPFHIDPEAAKQSMFGGLIASGWHTAAVWMKLMVASRSGEVADDPRMRSGVSPGFETMRWLKPVRPGMTLRYSAEIVEKIDLKSRPELGLVKSRNEARDEAGELVLSFIGMGFVPRRPKGDRAMTLRGKMVSMTMSDGAQIGVYHVEPTGARRGGLVLVQEIFGVTDHIKELCDGYAADGYEVLGPSIYDREEPGFQATYSPEDIQKAMRIARGDHPFDLSIRDAQTCIDALKGKGAVFITGYCYGGTVTWAAACRCDGLAAASGYYGGNIAHMVQETPKCPTILHFGKHDHGIPPEVADKIKALHPEVEVYLYDAGHGFNSDRRTDYNEACAKLARERTLALFRAHGG